MRRVYTVGLYERFTERARGVVVLAQDEARALKHNYIGTEHILLGLCRSEDSLAKRALEDYDITADDVRTQVIRIIGQGDLVAAGQIPFTPRAKKVLELSLREALSLGHNYVGTEHILLALLREGEGVAARILIGAGAEPESVRALVYRMVGKNAKALAHVAYSANDTTTQEPPVPTDVLHAKIWKQGYDAGFEARGKLVGG